MCIVHVMWKHGPRKHVMEQNNFLVVCTYVSTYYMRKLQLMEITKQLQILQIILYRLRIVEWYCTSAYKNIKFNYLHT